MIQRKTYLCGILGHNVDVRANNPCFTELHEHTRLTFCSCIAIVSCGSSSREIIGKDIWALFGIIKKWRVLEFLLQNQYFGVVFFLAIAQLARFAIYDTFCFHYR